MRRRAAAVAGAFVAAALAGAGCVAARRDAVPADLACAVERVGPEAPGLPERVRVTVRNAGAEAVRLTLPRPMPGEGTGSVPFPLLGVFLRDAEGDEEGAICVAAGERRAARPKTVVLAPGQAWSREYALASFYFWGPCGPDTGGDFTRYFEPGDKELELRAAVLFDFREDARAEKAIVESDPIAVRSAFEDWLFRRKPTL